MMMVNGVFRVIESNSEKLFPHSADLKPRYEHLYCNNKIIIT